MKHKNKKPATAPEPIAQKREIRTFQAQEFRASKTDQGTTISGTAIVYDSLSEDLGGFREKIAPGAARASLAANDVMCLYNHESGKVLGRTSANTLRLTEDQTGVHFECLVPDSSFGRDLLVSMERRDVASCSFGFFCEKDDWKNAPDGSWTRTVEQANVFEITVCGQPAYSATSAKVDRALFPDGVPAEIREHVTERATPMSEDTADTPNANGCDCDCADCEAGNCNQCDMPECEDDNCINCPMQGLRSLKLRARLA